MNPSMESGLKLNKSMNREYIQAKILKKKRQGKSRQMSAMVLTRPEAKWDYVSVSEPAYPHVNNKTPVQLEDFFKILQRTMDHPFVKPQFRYSTYFNHSVAFGKIPLRPFNCLQTCSALTSAVRPRIHLNRSIPGTASRIANKLEAAEIPCTHLTRNSHLISCTKTCSYVIEYIRVIQQTLRKCISRAKKLHAEGLETNVYGLEQLGGFCKELNSTTSHAVLGTRIFTATASSGFLIVLDMFRDSNARTKLYTRTVNGQYPSENTSMEARIKIQASLDSVLQSYERIGRPGFCGDWTSYQKCNPDIIGLKEMEKVLMAMMNAFVCLSAVTADLMEVFRVFVYSDNVEKLYLLNTFLSYPSQDQKKIMESIETLNDKIREAHHLLLLVNTTTRRATERFAPLPHPKTAQWPIVRHRYWMNH